MNETSAIVIKEDISGEKQDVLRLDITAIACEYAYIGLWFACDRSQDVYVSTELYAGTGSEPMQASTLTEEITENSFKKSPKKEICRDIRTMRVAVRREGGRYCKMKAFPWMDEKSYINYKVIRNRVTSYDTLASGIIKGDVARFMKIGIEDGTGALDYNDEILFLVLVRSLPPVDWKFDPSSFAVQKLPMIGNAHLFNVKVKYTPWLGQDPMEGLE